MTATAIVIRFLSVGFRSCSGSCLLISIISVRCDGIVSGWLRRVISGVIVGLRRVRLDRVTGTYGLF